MAVLYGCDFSETGRKLTVMSDAGGRVHEYRPPWGGWLQEGPSGKPLLWPGTLESVLHLMDSAPDDEHFQWWMEKWGVIPNEKIFEPIPPPFDRPAIIPDDFDDFDDFDLGKLSGLMPADPSFDKWQDWGRHILDRMKPPAKRLKGKGDFPSVLFAYLDELTLYAWVCLGVGIGHAERLDKDFVEGAEVLIKPTGLSVKDFFDLSPVQRFIALGLPPAWHIAQSRSMRSWYITTDARGRAVDRAAEHPERFNKLARLEMHIATDSILAIAWHEFTWAVNAGMFLTRCESPGCGLAFLDPTRNRITKHCLRHSAPPGAPDKEAYEQKRLRTEKGSGRKMSLTYEGYQRKKDQTV